MATRFGGRQSPWSNYVTKIRWLVAGLTGVIVVLIATIVVISQNANKEQPSTEAQAVPQPLVTFDILVAAQRIEAGEQILPTMLLPLAVPAERVPEGSVPATEKETLLNKFSSELISANMPITRDKLTERMPIHLVLEKIPPGYRAVSILVDPRTGVEGWARTDTRVDVIWTFVDDDKSTKVATIVPFARILSVGGATDGSGTTPKRPGEQTTITLLVKELDAKKIELARTTGNLSLSLLGNTESPKLASDPSPIDIRTLLPRQAAEPQEDPVDGVMYAQDGSGRYIRYVLKGRKWVRDKVH